jgi:oligopeptide transport system substrate-binding protein
VGLGGRPPRPAVLAPAVLGLALLISSCTTPPRERQAGPLVGPTASPTGEAGTTVRLSTLKPDSLDPAQIDAPQELLLAAQLFDGLVAYDPTTLELVPAVARGWKVEEGGERIVFTLRKGVRFHDGTPLTAGHLVASWSRLADPLTSAPFSFLLERVKGYDKFQRKPVTQLEGLSAPDDRTFEVRLTTPWPDFVALTGHPALSPVPVGAASTGLDDAPAGTGPYVLASPLAPGAPVILQRFPRYYGPPAVTERLEFEVVEELEAAWPDFLAGELDQATIPASALTDAESLFGTDGIAPLARLLYCGFNQADERFRDRRLRLAASLAIDREALASRVYGDLAVPAAGFVPPPVPGARADACGDRCAVDVERAASLVQEVPRSSRSFALDYTRSPVGDSLARLLESQLEEAGFEVDPRPHGEAEYTQLLATDRQEFFCLVWSADYPRQQALLEPLFLSGSQDNHAGVDDPALTDLLKRARAQRAPKERRRLYVRAEDLALADMQLVPLVWFRSHLAVQPYVEGFAVDALGLFDASALRIAP